MKHTAPLPAEGKPIPNPGGCRWCGVDKYASPSGLNSDPYDHVSRWVPDVGWHPWTQPTTEQIKARMLARRARRSTP
ncbi:hypothetical protein GCM10027187_40450 [Streptosporangium sandarakinum]|uniref:Uncharacterized protein n=1 Tax=Streptosporangium sandarakinum TaxID=1260955 RepID=A0A852VC43_9ACTN|nr:hypothetical protein [Streptosporangium sandarakinum]NYF44624.1 hypothetical protein [Streptosporangium sandarakinum]